VGEEDWRGKEKNNTDKVECEGVGRKISIRPLVAKKGLGCYKGKPSTQNREEKSGKHHGKGGGAKKGSLRSRYPREKKEGPFVPCGGGGGEGAPQFFPENHQKNQKTTGRGRYVIRYLRGEYLRNR